MTFICAQSVVFCACQLWPALAVFDYVGICDHSNGNTPVAWPRVSVYFFSRVGVEVIASSFSGPSVSSRATCCAAGQASATGESLTTLTEALKGYWPLTGKAGQVWKGHIPTDSFLWLFPSHTSYQPGSGRLFHRCQCLDYYTLTSTRTTN